MRVLYLSRGGNPHDRRFLAALADSEHRIAFAPMEVSADSEREFIPESIDLFEMKRGSNLEDLAEVLDHMKPDLVHAGPIQTGAYRATQLDWHPLVSMSWGSDLLVDARDGEGKHKAQQTLAGTDLLLCDCDAVREAAVALGMSDDRIIVFPWGVDLVHFSPGPGHAIRDQLGWQDYFVVLSTRAWEPLYGVDLLAKAFSVAASQDPSLRLLILNEGSLRTEVLARFEQNDVLDRIHAPGSVNPEHLPGYYRAADLYVSASHSDGTSISLLESMACGIPSVVSDIPANREWVRHKETGWWFEDGDSNDLAARLLEAAAATKRLPRMGRHARDVAELRGDWTANFTKLLEAYEMAITLERRLQ